MDNPQLVSINLQQLEWTNLVTVGGGGGFDGGSPTAAPYLWTIFFKADGQTLQVAADGTVAGAATVAFTPGSHGNLGTRSVHVGDPISIPTNIGQWSTLLQPIPVAPPLQGFIGKEFPATIGFVAVLMNEDHVSDHGAEAGHQALNAAVQTAIASVIGMLGLGHTMVTAQDIANAAAQIPSQVSNAIENAQSFWENLWSVSGPDQTIGFKVVTWSQPQLPAPAGQQKITQLFGPDWNSWELDGVVSADDLCSALSAHIIAIRRNATHCTRNSVVEGQQCVFHAQVTALTLPVSEAFKFSWSVVRGGTIVSGQTNQSVVVNVDSGASQIAVSVNVTDNFGCSITPSKTFDVLSQEMAGAIDRICALRDELQAVRVPIPVALLHPAGPDPGPERALQELNRLSEHLATAARSFINLIRRG